MPSILIISDNEREKRILLMAFEQLGFDTVDAEPDRSSYINAVQFKPDIVLIRFPRYYHDHINFCKNISNIKNLKTLIIGYGKKLSDPEVGALHQNGVQQYLLTPIRFSLAMKYIENFFQQNNSEKLVWKKEGKEESSYLDMLLDKKVLPTKKISRMLEEINTIMAFPFTVMRVLKISNDPQSGAADLSKVIEADPVIASNILKMANTVFFANRNNQRINSIKDAIVRIGFSETKNIAMSIQVMKSLSSDANSLGFDRKKYWIYCISMGILTSMLAKKMAHLDKSEAFLAGLLHSFGIILLDECFPDLFITYLKETSKKMGLFWDSERRLTLITHLDITKKLFEQWKFPSDITEGIPLSVTVNKEFADNASLWEAKPGELTEEQAFAVLLFVAEKLAKACGFGSECDHFTTPLPHDLLSYIRFSPQALGKEFFDEVQRKISLYSSFFNTKITKSPAVQSDITVSVCSATTEAYFPIFPYLHSRGILLNILHSTDDLEDAECIEHLCIYCTTGEYQSSDHASIEKRRKRFQDRYSTELPVFVFCKSPPKEQEPDSLLYYFDVSCDIRLVDPVFEEILSNQES
ncbi:response regulator [Chitinivibrio alkaliphilus]|uniref:HDOD domain-containing protein n=1 Tax=Chitinivibrio alkaliphilus ACht1 TaxID=1313304 RepID=U7DEI2_9BACT|nr:response regulator [Chitinivibrio alkaliphilus]ERP39336.1 hypothetical protein CALK_0132 [Chitinivibrio alkaliphilus ACht1]